MRNFTAVPTAFAAFALLFGFGPVAPAQTWVETHPVLIDASSRASGPETKADAIPKLYREARLRPDDEPKPDDAVKTDGGSLDHPANATGESRRHE